MKDWETTGGREARETRAPGAEEGTMSAAGEEVAPPPPPPPPLPPLPPPDEMECKICYQRYNLRNRRPKVLACLHRVCARCLGRILDAAEGGSLAISCPFCRRETGVSGRRLLLSELPDDAGVVGRLSTRDKSWSSDLSGGELLLTPGSLAAASPSSSASSPSRRSSHCLVITVVEVPGEPPSELNTEQSLDSLSTGSEGLPERDVLFKACTHVPSVLLWLLGFFYLSSLPLGIYLLVIQRVTLGVVCVSLVPSSLTVCLVYGICLLVPLPGRE
ncbi:E3 ubiquitin-protein ligase RNF182 [Gadus macrocephalus]|uniref:E3 ubiquitin-protein ligase RNF182 n=1 Tax=Gadus macrocephalus TaxID=80720 RepID=UPI0028CB3277|nr:E3 ubiquitin-protein ligase RNF182 [Gadus macrocephalus]